MGARFEGYKGGSGVWVITNPSDKTLDDDGTFSDIKFIVHNGGDFGNRNVTIKTFTKDGTASENNDFVNITLKDSRPEGDKDGNGTDVLPDFTLNPLEKDIFEDMGRENGDLNGNLLLGNLFDVNSYTVSNPVDNGYNWAVTFTDIPADSEVIGLNGRSVYSYKETVDSVEKTYYVVSGTTSTAVTPDDIKNELNNVQILLPKDVNSKQDAPLKSDFNITGTISVTKGGSSYQSGEAKIEDREIAPVTDAMTVTITANSINEDGTSNININLSNPSDGSKTELGDTISITVIENWKDIADGGGTNGTLTVPAGYKISSTSTDLNGNKVYNIQKDPISDFSVGDINGLTYTPASNRDGEVKFEVSVKNNEKESSVTLDSKGDKTITVAPVIDTVLEFSTVVATGTEDLALVGLANPLKVTITASGGADALVITDKSETLGNIVLDKIPNGMTVWYMDGGNLKMATNIGTSTESYTLNPNGDNTNVGVNKWLIPTVGSNVIPEIYINAPENWAGTFDFDVKLSVYEQNLATPVGQQITATGTIAAVADGVTIAPTQVNGSVFSWVALQLNANMKDVDGSEVMNLELTGLSASSQFRIKDGAVLNGTQAVWDATNSKWTITGIKYDEINKIQFTNDKKVDSVGIKAWTQELDADGKPFSTDVKSTEGDATFKLELGNASTSNFILGKDINIDFSAIDNEQLKNLTIIDLRVDGKNELLNLKLEDILDMGKKENDGKINLEILGTNQDKVSFADSANWTKANEVNQDGFWEYTNTDSSVKVQIKPEIEQPL
ncbi:hypothetical protein [Aliarcobacter cryaerophilus]|uniref:Uncharacterized protein n=1 Tax=Aliarcobacter cryaerophilus TaxID=28198 RepID=A0A2S9TGG3_9BACT|nr:hypothetical protein [Aliarcobacter cryaerophilus]PRM97926.1 hypothetical protein CJ670_04460 [Arcobacter cryaerophilus gv. crypticus]